MSEPLDLDALERYWRRQYGTAFNHSAEEQILAELRAARRELAEMADAYRALSEDHADLLRVRGESR